MPVDHLDLCTHERAQTSCNLANTKIIAARFAKKTRKLFIALREGTFFIGGEGGWGRGILEFFCEKSRGPPTSWNGLMHDPSETPKQKHLILPLPTPPPPLPIEDKNNRKLKIANWKCYISHSAKIIYTIYTIYRRQSFYRSYRNTAHEIRHPSISLHYAPFYASLPIVQTCPIAKTNRSHQKPVWRVILFQK